MMSFYGPDSVWDISRWGLGTHAGPAAIQAFFEDWIGAFDGYAVEIEELLDLGNGVVFTVGRQRGRPRGSRSSLELQHAAVFVWAGEVAVRVTNYRDLEEGRAAAERLASAAA
jgi:hypothetical protein